MQILLLYGRYSKGIQDYVTSIVDEVYDYQNVQAVQVPKLSVYDQSTGRQILQDITRNHEHDVIHIQYDNHMLETNACPFEQLENIVWFINMCQEHNKRVVITLHGIQRYDSPQKHLLEKVSLKLLHRYWKNKVLPAWKTCDIIVHNYNHKQKLRELGCDTNVHVIYPHIKAAIATTNPDIDGEVHAVIPGKRSEYKNYDHAFELLSLLPENFHLHISDQGDIPDDAIANIARRYEIIDRLHLVTFDTNKSDYLDQLKQYDIAILPYKEDVPSSGSLQDCLSVMLPCVTSNTQSFREFNNRYACIIPCASMVNTGNLLIRRLVQDVKYMDKLVENIKQYHDTNTSTRVKQQLYNVYTPPTIPDTVKDLEGTINVFMCCRDNQDTLQHTLDSLVACERHLPSVNFRYNILENDSEDDTPEIIQRFYETNKGNYSCYAFGNTKWGSDPGTARMRDMARYRNLMKLLCSEWKDSQYSFIVDSEIQFDDDIMLRQIEYLQQNPEVVMVTPYGTVGTSDVYYDRFAYRDMNNTQDITNVKDRVRSAFGGFVCIRTPALQRCEWNCVDGDTSEHVTFCDMVRRYGDVAIDKKVIVRW